MSGNALNILEALDNLNALVDAESLDQIEITDHALLVVHDKQDPEYWVQARADEETLSAVRATFRAVHEYLMHFYEKMREEGEAKKLVEGINTIMVLVGEASRKLERFGDIFNRSITEIPEYKELQGFYRHKVIREVFRDFAKVPIPMQPEVEAQESVEEVGGVHILNDVDVVKRDHLYELFYLKNEVGAPFYSTQLARNIKLACDFGGFAEEFFSDDPLLQVKNWEDKGVQDLARKILDHCQSAIQKFYEKSQPYREMELVNCVHKALMALMLAANPRNLIRQFSQKGCHRYFADFQQFFRQALWNREYQKFIIYAPPSDQPFFQQLVELIGLFGEAVYTLGPSMREVSEAVGEIVGPVTDQLSFEEATGRMQEALKNHPSGPVFKALDLIREEGSGLFDPLIQGNIGGALTQPPVGPELIRLPCPTSQEYINHADINEEFKAYLRSRSQRLKGRHLVINFQDRTSWRESARAKALEGLGNTAEFSDVLTVVTLAHNTEFFHQSGMYEHLGEASEFIEQLCHHLQDETTGYFIPKRLKKELSSNYLLQLIQSVHKHLFSKQDILSTKERREFIFIVYLLLTNRLAQLEKPTSVSFSTKDGLDISSVSEVCYMAMMGVKDRKELIAQLFGPTMLYRERMVEPELCALAAGVIERLDQGNITPCLQL